MFSKISVKVAILVTLVLSVVVVAGSYYIIKQQSDSLEAQLLERGKIESILGAKLIGRVIEEAIDNGVFSVNDAFDTDYVLIPGFEPAKYHTKYDFYLDKAILSLQDEFLKDDSVVFAVTVDINGYLPTHNTRYQQPITGDQKRDLIGNRTKRIFNDEIGIQAAHNTVPAFQQVYHRDTGVTMWDISTPIHVKGKHWGGFRIGFSLGKIEEAKQALQSKLIGIMAGILVVSLLIIFIVVDRALKPLTHFTRVASELADGNVENKIEVKGNDEIAQLADVLERLRVSLKTAMARLNKKV
ncbi:HAMP domain-containing protein [uncultured Desulfuromusa sp.]|uniref:HAMP domain-containing protein n=1 Tax=uncultured Desulfuromusa sp. TaxID=219183 RepID=UPI002AA833C8|nr:HAMP domain-containing protein [uncultured Desulfuromusa sp.]